MWNTAYELCLIYLYDLNLNLIPVYIGEGRLSGEIGEYMVGFRSHMELGTEAELCILYMSSLESLQFVKLMLWLGKRLERVIAALSGTF